MITIVYGISDLDAVLESERFLYPFAEIYLQITGSAGGSFGLLLIMTIPLYISRVGCYITASRVFWTLARDNVNPFSNFFSIVSPKTRVQNIAIVFCMAFATILGCIYMGSSKAFNAFVGSYVVHWISSYLAAILPHLLSRRRHMTPGYFWVGGATGYVVNTVSCLYIIVFIVIF